MKKHAHSFLFLLMLSMLLLLTACGGSTEEATSGEAEPVDEPTEVDEEVEEEEAVTELFEIKQITSWFPQVENAGQYYAAMEGFYEEAGLEMTTEPGGPQVSSISIVSSGSAQIGMAQADQVLYAINEGIPLVAFFANFQKTPQGIMFHADQPIETYDDLADGYEIYTAAGAGYWEFLVSQFEIEADQNRVYTGDSSAFVSNEKAASQMYVTSEPFYLAEQGVETGHLLIADSGYSPYGDVLFTTKAFMEEHPEVIQAYVDAITKGWEAFKEDPAKVYDYIIELEPEKTVDQMEYATEQMQELVFGGDAEENGVGYMSTERWEELIGQLVELGLLDSEIPAEDVFTTEFLN
ncbi:nitrate/sulfonate/bicarbonate ABC transporter substrate-binding protein [Halalkalibacter wakoensis JCM 9140]|uniref:Nitrate/sulfonate/bicarbonate ABC transporter substrate-binding protein n=1 Tax=Halalkalibacter wakoensis JCM 9140 TaxID=1236970 RepID=W4Q786_9BACI|nr:ABC transporter substrate-binding protein [Halalkalibacter wakoensis]GAE27862.1 nitrate/sulfonate/bicarbonate ABC transporter substrate-binding protein [Halalkalibacter wakoensis JCM 9140]